MRIYKIGETSTSEETRINTMNGIEELGLTADNLVEMTGLSKATINKFLKGKTVAGRTICEIYYRVSKKYEEVR